MNHATRRLILRTCWMTLIAAAPAQTDYYVNGMTGLDQPTHGGAAATPWKTIGYALANAAAPAVVHVAGNQVYAPSTNGESLPIAAMPGVTVRGASGAARPRFAVPQTIAVFQFAAALSFDATARLENLVFENGVRAVRLGSDTAHTHDPAIVDCLFWRQQTDAIRIENLGATVDAPRIERCHFEGPGLGPNISHGVRVLSQFANATTQPTIRDCDFRAMSRAIQMRADLATATRVGGLVEGCTFSTHDGAVVLLAGGPGHYSATVRGCRFTACNTGVVGANSPIGPAPMSVVTVDDCVFYDMLVGINPQLGGGGAQQRLEVTDSTFVDCDSGIDTYALLDFTSVRRFADLWFDSCQIGIRFGEIGPTGHTDARIERCRVTRCQQGIVGLLDQQSGTLSIASSMITQCSGAGIDWDGYPGQLQPGLSGAPARLSLQHVTIADNFTGISIQRPYATAAVDNSILAGNVQPLWLAANVTLGVDHTCLENIARPGTGNLNFTAPQLDRPFYKLAPTSPCIDAGAGGATSPVLDYEGDPRASQSTASGPLLPDLGADEVVWTGSARRYGTGGRGRYGIAPRIGTQIGIVQIGSTLQVQLSGAIALDPTTPANGALLVLGWRDDPGTRPFDLAAFGMLGSYLWNDHIGTYPMQSVATNGTAAYGVAIPNQLALAGRTFTGQWFALFPAQLGVVGSDGLRVTIGR